MFQQLSDTELMIMEYLWSQNIPKTFSEIKAFFEATTNKNWKKQTLSTFLLRLVKKEALYANHQEAKVTYYPALSSEEYYQQYTSQIIQTSFHFNRREFTDIVHIERQFQPFQSDLLNPFPFEIIIGSQGSKIQFVPFLNESGSSPGFLIHPHFIF